MVEPAALPFVGNGAWIIWTFVGPQRIAYGLLDAAGRILPFPARHAYDLWMAAMASKLPLPEGTFPNPQAETNHKGFRGKKHGVRENLDVQDSRLFLAYIQHESQAYIN